MMIKKYHITLFLFLVSLQLSFGQKYLGFSHARYAGILGAEVNPASILSRDLKSDWLFPIAFDITAVNNHLGFEKQKGLFSIEDYSRLEFVYQNRKTTRANLIKQINGPALMIRMSDKHAIGLSTKLRTYIDYKAKFSEESLNSLQDESLFSSDQTLTLGLAAEATGMSWAEANLIYSRKLFENKYVTIKGGGAVKILNGIAGGAVDFDLEQIDVSFGDPSVYDEQTIEDLTQALSEASPDEIQQFLDDIRNNPTGNVTIGDVTINNPQSLASITATVDGSIANDYSQNIDRLIDGNAEVRDFALTSNWGAGLDIGFTFEYRDIPLGFNKYLRRRIHKPIHSRREDPGYKWKLSVAVLDIGNIKFDRGRENYKIDDGINVNLDLIDDTSGDLDTNSIDEVIDDFNNIDDLESFARKYGNLRSESGKFSIGLPTTLNIDWDYHWKRHFYVNVNAWVSLAALKFSDYTVRNVSKLNVTPRYERDALAFFLPLSVNYQGQFDMGVAFKTGPLLLGIQNIGPLLYQKKINRVGVYFALAKGFAAKKSNKKKKKSIYFRDELKRYNR